MPKAKPKYKLSISMNNEITRVDTTDLMKELAKITPYQIFTEVFITIEKDGVELLRHYTLPQAKRLFGDAQQVEILLNNLIF